MHESKHVTGKEKHILKWRPDRTFLLASLALKDLWHDRKVTFCMVASLVSVIAPLLLLFGLKFGVVEQLQQELMKDPVNLEIRMLSSGSYSSQWIEALQSRSGVGFAIGLTRSLNTQADLVAGRRHFVENAEIIPTAAGDPLLGLNREMPDENSVILSAPAARRLQVEAGDSITLRISRRLNGHHERGVYSLRVQAVLDAAGFHRPAAFVASSLLLDMERFRDGFRFSKFGIDTGTQWQEREVSYSRARVYAADIEQVASLETWLNNQNIETRSRLREIENVKAINNVLGFIFGVVALTALIGCIASLVGAFMANIDRKHKELAVLRLIGFNAKSISLYVLFQAVFISAVAYLGGLFLYFTGSVIFNRVLVASQATGDFACRITVTHAVSAFLLSLFIAILVSIIGALRAVSFQPAETLREL